MSNCPICHEKQIRINALLKGYKRDKKIGLITIGCLLVELILTLAYGKDGIMMGIEIIKGVFK